MQRIADETGAVIGGTLYGDLLSPVGGEADSYIKMLRHDEACPGEGWARRPRVCPCFKVYKGSKAGVAVSDAEIASSVRSSQ
jgi:hypothetical protein